MWISVNEIVEWDYSEKDSEGQIIKKPITHPVYVDASQIIMMREQTFGTEIYIKNTWLYVTDEVNDILSYIPER